MNHKLYIKIFLVTLLASIGAVAVFNFIVDPGERLDAFSKPGFNQAKVTLRKNSRSQKASVLLNCNYDFFILGSSRAESGLMPASVPAGKGRVYNSALKETSMHETEKVVDFILLHQQPTGVVIGLDFLAFSNLRHRFYDFDKSKLNTQQSMLSFVPYLASKQILADSIATMQANMYTDIDICAKSGFDDQRLKFPEPNDIFAKVLGRYRQDPQLYAAFALSDDHLMSFRQTLTKLAENATVSYLFISPIHANQLNLIAELGLHDDFDEMKRQMSSIVSEINELYGTNTVLWDFSGYNSITTEALPALGSELQMTWYRDPSHYRVETGQLMLKRMFGAPAGVPRDFGVSLRPETVDDHLAQQWQLGELHRARQAAELLTTPAL